MRLLARATLVVVAIALVAGVGELVLRAIDWPRFDACVVTADYAVPDPVLGFAAEPGSIVAGFELNARGLRGASLESPKPPGRRRVLFLGDSTAFGLGVPLERTFAARSLDLLQSDFPNEELELLLGAFPGYSSYQSEILLQRLLLLEPDLVVFYVGARNDAERADYYRDADIPARRARPAQAWHQVRVLRSVEALLDRFYRSLLRKLRTHAGRARVPPADFRGNMERMAERLAAAGVPGLVLVPPLSAALLEKQPIAGEYRDALEVVASRFGLPLLRLQPIFEAEPPSVVYFEDGYHFSERGHEIAGRAIARAVRDARLLD